MIKNNRRNTKADIFSLGCVLAETFVWIHGIEPFSFHEAVRSEEQAPAGFQYALSIAEIKDWFEGPENNPGCDASAHIFKRFYVDVLKRMVRTEPAKRWKATDISWAVSHSVPDGSACLKCDTYVWVPMAQSESDKARRKRLELPPASSAGRQ